MALIVLIGLLGSVAACSSEPTQSGDASALARPPVTQPADPPRCFSAPAGTILSRRITSKVTGGTERMRIYLPPRFEQAKPGTVALLILLHGASADETQWIDVGITSGADCLIAAGEIGPMVIVAVDGTRVETNTGGSPPPPMERFITDEVLPYMRANYPTLAGAPKTSIGGISRAGGWALHIAADRPDLFTAVGGHSPATDLSATEQRSLATHNVRVWLDVGKQDPLWTRVQALDASLSERGGGALFMTWDGGHDRRYWSHHVEDYLRFYAREW